MPAALVQKYAKKHKLGVERAEHLWHKAKSIARKEFKEKDGSFWPYVVGIFKRMLGEGQPTLSDLLIVEAEKAQYANDHAERAMIHKIIDYCLPAGRSDQRNFDKAYDFLESDWGGQIWDKFYSTFKSMQYDFEGPTHKGDLTRFKNEVRVAFKNWANGRTFKGEPLEPFHEAKVNPAYVKGLKKDEKEEMKREIKRFSKMDHRDKDAYPEDWTADRRYKERGGTTKPSKHTEKFKRMYGEGLTESAVSTALKNKAEKTGVSISVLRKVYNRGLAAWRTGHRPGVSQHQWAMARVNSFLTGGKAATVDKDLK